MTMIASSTRKNGKKRQSIKCAGARIRWLADWLAIYYTNAALEFLAAFVFVLLFLYILLLLCTTTITIPIRMYVESIVFYRSILAYSSKRNNYLSLYTHVG